MLSAILNMFNLTTSLHMLSAILNMFNLTTSLHCMLSDILNVVFFSKLLHDTCLQILNVFFSKLPCEEVSIVTSRVNRIQTLKHVFNLF